MINQKSKLPMIQKIVLGFIASQIIAQRNIFGRLRTVGIGVGFLIMSGLLGFFGILGGIFSIFFALADVSRFIYPSLIAGGVSLLVAILLAAEGKRLLRAS